ncbi:MAG: phage holin family protein [Verrucomicrobiota bacterium]
MNPFDKAASIGQTILEIVEARLELFGLEVQQEKAQLATLIGSVAISVACSILAGVAGIVAIALATPEEYRAWVLGGTCLFFLILLGVCLTVIYNITSKQNKPFTATRSELKKDAECLGAMVKPK